MARTHTDVVADLHEIFKSADMLMYTVATLRGAALDSAQTSVCKIALDRMREVVRELEELMHKEPMRNAPEETSREPERKRARLFDPRSIPGKVGYRTSDAKGERMPRLLVAHAMHGSETIKRSLALCIKNAIARGEQREADIIRGDLSDLCALHSE